MARSSRDHIHTFIENNLFGITWLTPSKLPKSPKIRFIPEVYRTFQQVGQNLAVELFHL
jgi:hypothetical protein